MANVPVFNLPLQVVDTEIVSGISKKSGKPYAMVRVFTLIETAKGLRPANFVMDGETKTVPGRYVAMFSPSPDGAGEIRFRCVALEPLK